MADGYKRYGLIGGRSRLSVVQKTVLGTGTSGGTGKAADVDTGLEAIDLFLGYTIIGTGQSTTEGVMAKFAENSPDDGKVDIEVMSAVATLAAKDTVVQFAVIGK